MEGARAHFHVIGLQQNAALLPPEPLQAQDHVLERILGPQGGRSSGGRCPGRCCGFLVHVERGVRVLAARTISEPRKASRGLSGRGTLPPVPARSPSPARPTYGTALDQPRPRSAPLTGR